MLLKPQAIEYCQELSVNSNVKVDHIAVTEQGFHYLLSSIDSESLLFFNRLSFYSDVLLALGQQITIKIKPHKYQVFTNM